MNSRDARVTSYRAAGWLLAITLAVPALTAASNQVIASRAAPSSLPPWNLKLAIHYLPPPSNRSQYDVVLAWRSQAWFLGGTDVGGHGKPKAELIKNGNPQATALPAGAHSWIAAASAPSPADIWAVTSLGGSVLNWNGSAWRTETPGSFSRQRSRAHGPALGRPGGGQRPRPPTPHR